MARDDVSSPMIMMMMMNDDDNSFIVKRHRLGSLSWMMLTYIARSHPIEVMVRKSSEVNEIFDEISYCKGAAVIMMITSYLGMELFQKACL